MRYELLNKDVVTLTFELDALCRVVGQLEPLDLAFAPPSVVGLDGTARVDDVAAWWSRRSIPATRLHLGRLLDALGLDSASPLALHSLGLSLSDRYWVRPAGSDLAWADVNFFDNDFDGALGTLTLNPWASPVAADLAATSLMSPDSTVGGDVPKRWVIDQDGRRILVKAPSRRYDQDPYNEVVACALYRRLMADADYVTYWLVGDADVTCCACPNMLGEDEELVSAADLMRRHGRGSAPTYPNVLRALEQDSGLPPRHLAQWLSRMFSCDFLLANSDRHLGNFGLVRDCVTLEYRRVAPIFDSGCSLWCDTRRLESPGDYRYHPRPFPGRPSQDPASQLRLFSDYGWLDAVASTTQDLAAWQDEARDALALDPDLPAARLDAIMRGVRDNVAAFLAHVERSARLCPATAVGTGVVPSSREGDDGTTRR